MSLESKMGWETKIIYGGGMLIWIRLGFQDGRENWRRQKGKRKDTKEEDGKLRLGRREGQGMFFVKVHMSGWQAARGIQPKNLFNVCFTG